MAWTALTKGRNGPAASRYGRMWLKQPGISIRKGHVTFNAIAVRDHGLAAGKHVHVLADAEAGTVGFRAAAFGNTNGAYSLCTFEPNSPGVVSSFVNMPAIARLFPNAVGKAYVLHYDDAEDIAYAVLNSENEMAPGKGERSNGRIDTVREES